MTEPRELIEIPIEELGPEVLTNLIESFVLREGTDYGAEDASFSRKIEQVRAQLKSRAVKLVFDTETESCHILTDVELRDFRAGPPVT